MLRAPYIIKIVISGHAFLLREKIVSRHANPLSQLMVLSLMLFHYIHVPADPYLSPSFNLSAVLLSSPGHFQFFVFLKAFFK